MMKKVDTIPGRKRRIALRNVAEDSRSKDLSTDPACMLRSGPQESAYPDIMKKRATMAGPETRRRM
jgi:hypothetical protein